MNISGTRTSGFNSKSPWPLEYAVLLAPLRSVQFTVALRTKLCRRFAVGPGLEAAAIWSSSFVFCRAAKCRQVRARVHTFTHAVHITATCWQAVLVELFHRCLHSQSPCPCGCHVVRARWDPIASRGRRAAGSLSWVCRTVVSALAFACVYSARAGSTRRLAVTISVTLLLGICSCVHMNVELICTLLTACTWLQSHLRLTTSCMLSMHTHPSRCCRHEARRNHDTLPNDARC